MIPRAARREHFAALSLAVGLAACASPGLNFSFGGGEDGALAPSEGPPPLRPGWRVNLAARDFFLPWEPEERSAPAALASGHSVIVGTSDGTVRRISMRDGSTSWSFRADGAVHGDVSTAAGRVYVGADDGHLHCLDATSGESLWKRRVGGTVQAAPTLHEGRVLVRGEDEKIRALDAVTGKWLWEYGRDLPDGFTLLGAPTPVVAGGRVLVGFADGTLVSLLIEDGSLVWSADLSNGATEFTDVDATPLVLDDKVFASSFSGGVHALRLEDGERVWHLPHRSVLAPVHDQGSILLPTAEGELLSVDAQDGRTLYRRRLAAAGSLGQPVPLGRWWVVPSTRRGLLVIDPASGVVIQRVDAGTGVTATPAIVGGSVVVLSNGGYLYAFEVVS
jgi:outer membrane protein assembly factor BamB